MKLFKQKSGFTLIELLVVIGILAVLAAIAIPSVAGLIDRANVSADQTNANEMTNAMERFVSEYELYRQDIASGLIKDKNGDGTPDNLDAAQSRVYNVTGATTLDDIRALESESGLNGIRIDIDSKYAQNSATAKAVMENYMKTSSSIFEPKQSDMTYWYNTVTGYTVVAEKNANISELENRLPSNVRYNNSSPSALNEWMDLGCNVDIPNIILNSMKFDMREVDNEMCPHVIIKIEFANPKYSSTPVDLNKLHILNSSDKWAYLDMESQQKNDIIVGNILTEDNKEYIESSEKPMISLRIPKIYSTTTDYTNLKTFRLAYEYIENGETRYAYSAIFAMSLNDLMQQ